MKKEKIKTKGLPTINFIKLEQIGYMKSDMTQFFKAMFEKMEKSFDKKGRTYINCDKNYLFNEFVKHTQKEDWIDVANFCFMLWYNLKQKRVMSQ